MNAFPAPPLSTHHPVITRFLVLWLYFCLSDEVKVVEFATFCIHAGSSVWPQGRVTSEQKRKEKKTWISVFSLPPALFLHPALRLWARVALHARVFRNKGTCVYNVNDELSFTVRVTPDGAGFCLRIWSWLLFVFLPHECAGACTGLRGSSRWMRATHHRGAI